MHNEQLIMNNGHDQLHLFTEEEPSKKVDLTLELLTQFWHQSFIVEGYESRVDAEAARVRGEGILKLYFDWWQQQDAQVLAVEKGFTLDLDGFVLSGRFDRVEKQGNEICVIDYKTSKPRTQQQVDEDLQLSIYALACEQVFAQPCASLSFLFLNEDGMHQLSTTRSAEQLQAAAQVMQELDKDILQGLFEPTPSATVCGRCPYKNVCEAAIL